MNITRILLAGLIALIGIPSLAGAAEYQEGRHYQRLNAPTSNSTGDTIEVVEIFWYGCPHCYELEPVIKDWLEDQPDNVEFKYIPAVLGQSWEPHARAYYTAEVLGVLDKIHQPLFDAIHAKGRRLATEEQLAEFFAEQGVEKEAFHKAYNSFDVEIRLRRAQQLVQRYRVMGVPAMVVNGKYLTNGNMAGSKEGIMRVVSYLVAQENKDV